jgi:hypothetical protein
VSIRHAQRAAKAPLVGLRPPPSEPTAEAINHDQQCMLDPHDPATRGRYPQLPAACRVSLSAVHAGTPAQAWAGGDHL